MKQQTGRWAVVMWVVVGLALIGASAMLLASRKKRGIDDVDSAVQDAEARSCPGGQCLVVGAGEVAVASDEGMKKVSAPEESGPAE